MSRVVELRNDMQEALERAKNLLEQRADAKEEEDRTDLDARYKRAWKDFENKKVLFEDAKAVEAADKFAGTPENQLSRPSEIRNPQDAIPNVAPEIANGRPEGFIELSPGNIVPYATDKTEGYIRKFPVAVQHASLMARYSPDMRKEKAQQEEAFAAYLRKGYNWVAKNRPDLIKPLNALQESDDSEGGYLVPTDQRMDVIFDPGAPGGVTRPESTVFTTTRDGGTWPTWTDGTWVPIGEEAEPNNTDPSVGQVPFTIRKSGANLKLSEELLADSGVNLPALIGASMARISGRYEDQQAIEGDGANEPLGVRTTGAPQGDIADITDELTKAGVTMAEVINAWTELPAQFRNGAIFHTTSSFFGTLCGIESTNGGVTFLRELTQSPTPTLMGNRIVMFDGTGWDSGSLSLGADVEVGCFGNFRNYYYFIDRVGMSLGRDDSRYADTDQVLFKARKRYDSLFAENNAFRILKAAT